MKTPSCFAASATLAAFIHCNTTMAWTSVRTSSDSVLPNSKVLQLLYRNPSDGDGDGDEINYIYYDIDKRRLLWKVVKNAGHEETYEQLLPDFIGSVSASVFKGDHLYIAGQLQYKQEWFISALNPNGEVIWIRQGNDNDPSGMPKDITFYKIMTTEEEKVIYAVGKTPSAEIVLELNSENGSDVSGEAFNKFSNRKLLNTSSNSNDDGILSHEHEVNFRYIEWTAGVVSFLGALALVPASYGFYRFIVNIREKHKAKITHAKDIESNRRKIEGDLIRKMARQQTSLLFMPPDSSVVIFPDVSVIDNPEVNVIDNSEVNTDADRTEQEELFTSLQNAVRQGDVEKVGNLLDSSPDLIDQSDSSGDTLLHIAITAKKLKMIKLLLSKGIKCDERNNQGFTPLHVAATQGDVNTLKELLDKEADIKLLNSQQHSPLHLAIINKHPEAVKLLIKSLAGIPEQLRIINQEDYQGNTPLHLVIINNHPVAVVKQLIKIPTRIPERLRIINKEDCQGNTPLHLAVLERNTNFVTLLLNYGASQELSNNDGFTPLYLAAISGVQGATQDAIIRVLLEWKSKFSQDELSALFHIAANFNIKSLMEMLLNRDLHRGLKFYQPCKRGLKFYQLCKPDTKDQFCVQTQSGLTVLHEAVLANSHSVVGLLIKERLIEINAKDDQGNTSLHYAIQNNDIEMIKILLKNGAGINIQNSLGYTPLHFAVLLENKKVVGCLMEHKGEIANPNICANDGRTPLSIAYKSRLIDIVKALGQDKSLQYIENDEFIKLLNQIYVLKKTKDEEIRKKPDDEEGLKKLHDEEIRKKLHEFDPDKSFNPNKQYFSGNTPLHVALKMELDQFSVIFISLYKPDLNIQNDEGQTPLHLALCVGGNQESIKSIIQQEITNLNIKNNEGQTPLHVALHHGNEATIELLIDGGVLLNVTNNEGQTPLHVASLYGNKAAVELLIDAGADLNFKNNKGETPLNVALRRKNQEAIKLLIENTEGSQLTDKNNESVLDLAESIGNDEAASLIRNKIESSKPSETKSDSEQNPPVVIELQN
ncbi:ankyrin repeat domain-containing protein [Endozoicomonas sp. 8E]|uniref:ankyrin repeat domain-containing protein n=1 Tax=Endozoicomonas sp. 8E TaxID=3035692 RepID=UPI002938D5B6|nr:ankyrin repeat domain-containing protein [Endozoicomonas sp. 8E]WOG29821.1 ankyrin repeat domain-containing protein [Endozoicomonas sp. 8E]